MPLSLQQFGQQIKTKYPQYQDIDDTELAKKMLVKFPQYQNKIDQAPQAQPTQAQPAPVSKPKFFEAGNPKPAPRTQVAPKGERAGDYLKSATIGGRVKGAVEGFTGAFSRAKERAGRGVESLKGIADPSSGKFGPQAALGLLGAAGEIVSSPFQAAAGLLKPEMQAVMREVSIKVPDSVKQSANSLVDAMPEDLKNIYSDAFASLGLLAAPSVAKAGKTGLKELLKRGSTKKVAKALPAIEQKIAPKLIAREKRLAIKEGRVTRPKESFLFGRKEDIVSQSKKVKQSAQTIQKNIKGADKMDEFTLKNTLDKKVGETAQSLKPDMQRVKISNNIKTKVKSAWEKTKKAQQQTVEFDTFPGLKRMQSNFQKYVDDLKTFRKGNTGKFREKNLDDLWDARKRFDKSVKDNIKNAGDDATDLVKAQQDMWLDNRRIFNDAINDVAEGLGSTSKTAFAEMSDYYRGIQNIISRGGIITKSKAGLITSKKIAGALGAGVLGKYFLFD